MREDMILKKKILKQKKLIGELFIIIIMLLSLAYILFTPSIILNGNENMNIEVGNKYKELGAVGKTSFKELKNIKISGKVNTKKLGTYKIKYILKYNGIAYKKIRYVNVVDTTKPVIKLNGNKNTNICKNKEYIDEGVTATDNYDGDLTKKIKIDKKENEIIYSVKDSSGNTSKVVRKLTIKDTENPVLTLNGDAYKYVYLNNEYNEEGASATDNCDDDITDKINISGSVNTSELGEYTITYEVTDSSGNTSKEVRTVKVVNAPGSGKVIYLTFDDGPSYTITASVLDILKEENVKATFFVINHDDGLNYLIKREYDEGHTVALHSFTHNYGQIYASVDAFFNDLELIRTKVKNITGYNANITRFPGGSSNTVSSFNPGIMTTLAREVTNRGYIYFDWNVSSGDAGDAYSSDAVYNNVTSGLGSKTNVVLMHDFESNYKTLNALRDIIRYGKENGYTFERITESTPVVRHGINN